MNHSAFKSNPWCTYISCHLSNINWVGLQCSGQIRLQARQLVHFCSTYLVFSPAMSLPISFFASSIGKCITGHWLKHSPQRVHLSLSKGAKRSNLFSSCIYSLILLPVILRFFLARELLYRLIKALTVILINPLIAGF